MVAKLHRLSARGVQTLSKPGRHADGGNLYLLVKPSGARSWTFMFKRGGQVREMGLGTAPTVTLARARELAAAARALLSEGKDPLAARASAAPRTFGEEADAYIEAKRSEWRNEKHAAQWAMTLRVYAAPLRERPVADIATADVLAVLKPIWRTKPETASRLRGRIESVLDAAKVNGLRSGENPALWRGHLSHLLPKRTKLSRGHHKAMAIDDVPGFMVRLRRRKGISARALELTILTAARTAETLGAIWSEIDLDIGVWIVPAERMKAGREHRVPLSADALAMLRPLHAARTSDHIFPGYKVGRPITALAMHKILRLEKLDVTIHGFRSAFRDWVSERTSFPPDLAEAALAHLVGDATERAYRRGDALERRRALMEAWAGFCGAESASIHHLVNRRGISRGM